MTDQLVTPPPIPLGEAALYWAGTLGVPVFPCEPMGKKPHGALAPHGVKDATTDPARIRAWLRSCTSLNLGAAMGDGVFALDIDGEEGKASLGAIQARHGSLPPTVAVVTGSGGWLLYFATPAGRTVRNSAGRLGPKLDVRGAGGYVVVPPSVHPSGRPYAFVPGREPWSLPLAMAPAWLLDLLDPPPAPPPIRIPPRLPIIAAAGDAYAYAALRHGVERGVSVSVAGVGQRNDTLNVEAFSLARFVVDGSLPASRIIAELADAVLSAGLDKREVAATLNSALRSRVTRGRESRHA